MPYKAWTVNEILTASDMNTYVGNQTVLSFAGTAARASALAAPVEGMVAYLEDTDRLEVYKGTAVGWVATVFPGGTPVANHLLQYDGTDWQSVSQSEAGAIAVFAGTAARGSAIPSPSEGMVTYRSDDDVVEVYDGSVFKAVGPGKILQVVSTTLTSIFSASVTAIGTTAITGLSASITPTNTNSKIFISVNVVGGVGGNGHFGPGIILKRDATSIGIGDVASNRTPVTSAHMGPPLVDAYNASYPMSATLLDSPNTTSATTYSVDVVNLNTTTQTIYINSSGDNFNGNTRGRSISTITLMEVAG